MENVKSLINDSLIINTDIKEIINETEYNSDLVKEKQKIALDLVDKFQSPQSMKFFLKVAWNIPQQRISKILTDSFDLANFPVKYFVTCCKHEMSHNV